jgi:hypothetical protein
MSPDWASEVTAIATAVLAVGAVVTTVFAIRAFTKQSGQLDLQRQQLDDQRAINGRQTEVLDLQTQELRQSLQEREREAAERHRAQASRVFIWQKPVANPGDAYREEAEGPIGVIAHVTNASDLPIYDVIISWHRGSAPLRQRNLEKPLMPGESEEDIEESLPRGTDLNHSGAVVFFSDAAGTAWRRRPDGKLDEINAGQEPPRTW